MNSIRSIVFLTALGLALVATIPSHAVPQLQLDIQGGDYHGVDPNDVLNESTITDLDHFILNAIFTPGNGANALSPDDTFSLVIGITDQDGQGISDAGSFSLGVNGIFYDQDDFHQGTPVPIRYGPYGGEDGTLHLIIDFDFTEAERILTYNVEDDPGDPVLDPDGQSLLMTFGIDASFLNEQYMVSLLVFDLFSGRTFAPYSHNAARVPPVVPEPAALLLFGAGLAALGSLRQWKRK